MPANCRIGVLGLPEDIAAMKSVLPSGRGIVFSTGSLEDAIRSIARTRVALTMDSGTMFFAKLLGVPTVTLFGPSDPSNVITPEADFLSVYEVKWPCQPCRSARCNQKSIYCMASIEPALVADKLMQLLRIAA
jgi:ADP-heptose:LPS heptosyltransferase